MNLLNLLERRRSTHNFDGHSKLSQGDFEEILEYVCLTPSGYNAQPWRFALLQSEKDLEALWNITFHQKQVQEAGNVVVVVADMDFGILEGEQIVRQWQKERDLSAEQGKTMLSSLQKKRLPTKKREMALRNASLAAMVFMLAAEELGWQTCPMMGFGQRELSDYLSLPEHFFPALMIAIGKQDKNRPEKKRLSRKSIGKITWPEQR